MPQALNYDRPSRTGQEKAGLKGLSAIARFQKLTSWRDRKDAVARRLPMNRRNFVSGIVNVGLVSLGCSRSGIAMSLFAETPTDAKRGLIDIHHHIIPPFYLSENRERIINAGGGRMNPAFLTWTPESMIAAMDKSTVAAAVLSLAPVGFWYGDREAAARMSRRANEYAADLVRNHPGRFGHFAIIPLPDTEASLHEIEYACGVLKADGITLLTSYDDKWLGHPDYQPVFEELNRRKAVVFVHPTTPFCCRTLLPDVPPVILEIPQDSTRAVTNLVFTGTLAKFRGIRFIFSHAGGNVPMVVGRMQQYAPKNIADKAPNGIEYELKRLHYDIAGTAFRPAIAALTSLVPTTQILFGSDNPFVPLANTAEGMMQLGFSADDLQRIGRDNALALLPQLKNSQA
jgi:6-methylsalicylate decarboxylase